MKNSHQLFLAFFIPFSAAIILINLGGYIFQDWIRNDQSPFERTAHLIKVDYIDELFKKEVKKDELVFSQDWGREPLEVQDLYEFLVYGLFILSAVLPIFIISRNKPIERYKLRLNN